MLVLSGASHPPNTIPALMVPLPYSISLHRHTIYAIIAHKSSWELSPLPADCPMEPIGMEAMSYQQPRH